MRRTGSRWSRKPSRWDNFDFSTIFVVFVVLMSPSIVVSISNFEHRQPSLTCFDDNFAAGTGGPRLQGEQKVCGPGQVHRQEVLLLRLLPQVHGDQNVGEVRGGLREHQAGVQVHLQVDNSI